MPGIFGSVGLVLISLSRHLFIRAVTRTLGRADPLAVAEEVVVRAEEARVAEEAVKEAEG